MINQPFFPSSFKDFTFTSPLFLQMGCCISTNKTQKKSLKISKISNSKKQQINSSKSPPPTHPLLDEEITVKEVLSETVPITIVHKKKQSPRTPFIKSAPLLRDIYTDEKHQNATVSKKPNNEPSAVSKIYKTLQESERNDAIYNARRQRSPAKLKTSFSGEVKRENKTADKKSPVRSRPEPVSSSIGCRSRKSGGEVSGRRSRSPVTRKENGSSRTDLGRTNSGRRTGSGLGDRIRKLDEGKRVGGGAPTTRNESVENPAVSLECFIFL